MKNKRAEKAWQVITSDKKFQDEITQIRQDFNIPIEGHIRKYHYPYQAIDKLIGDYNSLPPKGKLGENEYSPTKSEWSRYYKFSKEIHKLSKYSYKLTNFKSLGIDVPKFGSTMFNRYLNNDVLENLIEIYILYGETNTDLLESINTSGCDYFVVTHEERKWLGKLTDGLYIKVGALSTPTDLSLFLNQNKDELLKWQNFLALRENSPRVVTKNKISTKIKRNKIVKDHDNKTIEILQNESGSSSRRKDILISIIMEKEGIPTTADNVRQILGRSRKPL